MICKIQFFKVYISKIKHKQNQNTDNNSIFCQNTDKIQKKLLQHILQTVDLYKNKELEKSKEESSRAEEYNNWNLKYTRRNQ